MGIRHFALGILLLISTISTSTYALTLEEQWSDTSFSYKDSDALITDKNCQGHPRFYYGCTDGLQALLNTIPGNDLHIARRTAIIFHKPYVTLVRDLGEVILVKINYDKMLEGLPVEKAIQKEREFNTFMDREMIRSRIFKFAALYSEIKKMVPQQLEKAAAAAVLNAYNSNVIGPRNYYVPNKVRRPAPPAPPSTPPEEIPEDKKVIRLGVGTFKNTKGFLVSNVVYKSGAYNSDIRPLDIITHFNNQPASNMSSGEFADHVRGTVNTAYVLTVLRDNQVLYKNVKLVPFENLNVHSREIEKNLYIKVGGFSRNTCVDFKAALLKYPQAEAIIVDVRGNGGGLVGEMSCMLSPFIGQGASTMEFMDPITFTLNRVLPAPKPEFLDNRPVIVLTNQSSASASEAFSGAIQDYGIGFTVGLRTFGKGSAQRDIIDSRFKNTTLVKTVARYNLPSGRSPQLVGIKPDFEAYLNFQPMVQERYALYESDTHRFPLPKGADYGYNKNPHMKQVKDCLAVKGRAIERFKKEGDYQLQVARDVASCAALYGR
ncbi:MAG: S41 family peptidase [Bdellovibrionota bacterium]